MQYGRIPSCNRWKGWDDFATVVIDPPWPVSQSTLQKKGRDAYKPWAYPRMPLDQIRITPLSPKETATP